MSTRLGLDIGTNSIGWALMDDENIVDIGVHIFPAGRDDNDKETQNQKRTRFRGMRKGYDRYKQRRARLLKNLEQYGMLPNMDLQLTAPALYHLRVRALDEQITLQELGRIIMHLNQRRGFKSNKKDERSAGADEQKKLTEYKQELESTAQEIKSSFRTVGEYFYSLFTEAQKTPNWHNPIEPIKPIRNHLIYRHFYIDEFNKIWDKQQQYYPEILTEERREKIRDYCLYYQRPLKSQKHLVGFCTLEPNKRCAPKSSFEFQEFRIWQAIMNLRVSDSSRTWEPLSPLERDKLATLLQSKSKVSKTEIKKALGLESRAVFNDIDIPVNTTVARLENGVGKEYFDNCSQEEKYKLWHTLHFANEPKWLHDYAENVFGFSEEMASSYAAISLEDAYGSLSVKAIRKILPFMKDGNPYDEACRLAEYHHSVDKELGDPNRVLAERIIRNPGNRKDFIEKSKNPAVRAALASTARLINAIIEKHGKPDMIRVELARSVKQTAQGRADVRNKQKKQQEIKNDIRQKIHEQYGFNIETISEAQIRKYLLWEECNMVSPYTGASLPAAKLFSPEIQVDHIIPYRRSMNNSYMNLVVCEASVNLEKGDKTPYEFFGADEDKWATFKKRVEGFPQAKYERLTSKEEVNKDGFRPGQLADTGYIAREAVKMLKTVCYDVRTITGQVTALLRKHWGLNGILGSSEKNRDDSRHHAVDALVIANTGDYFINLLNGPQARTDQYGRLHVHEFPAAFDFNQAKQKIDAILISFHSRKRLLTKKKNKYVHSHKKQEQLVSRAARGPLHEETIWGSIKNPVTGEQEFVVSKSISSFDKLKQVESIVDPYIRKLIFEHIAENGGETKIKEAMKKPIFMRSKDGKKVIPIKSVRVYGKAPDLIQLRPNLNNKLYVEPGSNYCIAIYEHPKTGKRKFETVNFYTAVTSSLKKEPLFSPEKDGFPLLMVLQQGDLIITYKENEDEIDWNDNLSLTRRLFLVKKFDKKGNIGLSLHLNPGANPDKKNDYEPGMVSLKTGGSLKALKVKVSMTGEITRFQK